MAQFGKLVLVALVGLCFLANNSLASNNVDFKNPVRSAAQDEITNLPGVSSKLNFKQYSGYVEADDLKPTNRFWHYWFVESQSEPAKDPLVLWLNGGPGCSSLLGLLTELGPIRVEANGTISRNDYAWNKHANVVFLESPAGVGFSYAVDHDVKANDDTTAKQNHLALRSFLRKFPQYKSNPLYLTGESYGGVYLPTLGVLVDADPELNLKGIAIGNGYLDANKLAESLVYFSYYHGLVGRSTWNKLSKYCCSGKPPARGECDFTNDKRSPDCAKAVEEATDAILNSGINPYNLYDHCAAASSAGARPIKGREHFDRRLSVSAFNLTKRTSFSSLRLAKGEPVSLRGDPPCTDDSVVIDYLNKPETRDALHIPDKLDVEFTTCSDSIEYTMIYPHRLGGLEPQMRSLIDSARKLNIVVYNGDVDLMCNFFGDEWFMDDLNMKVTSDYKPWLVREQVAGYMKRYEERVSFMTVKGSGHMVPTDRPAEALILFEQYLLGLGGPNEAQSQQRARPTTSPALN